MTIRFNYPHKTGREIDYINEAMEIGRLAGGGGFTNRCQTLIAQYLGAEKILLTHSCTAALEMAAILFDIQAGDEVIMPSYTFVSTANAFVLRGGVPVFVDIREDTLNIDESKIEAAITPRTKAICVVHYAGVGCDMDAIMAIAKKHNLLVLEDAAQALGASYRGRKLGAIGDLAAISFHETKNIISGEGGALVINNPEFAERAEIIWEKGTDRSRFFRGEIDKYTWVDVGSSFLPSELVAAFLLAQLENIDSINAKRLAIWDRYAEALSPLDRVTTANIPASCDHNAHMFYVLMDSAENQRSLLATLSEKNIGGVFHYIPLHTTVAGKKYCRVSANLAVTEDIYARIIRLPLWPDITAIAVDEVIAAVSRFSRAP